MKKLPFAWLGSKRAKKQGAGDKAGLLDLGRRLGLPVPAGVVLLHRVYDLLLEAGVVVDDNQHIRCPNPDWLKQALLEDVRLPSLNGRMIIRAAFTNSAGQPFGPVTPVNDVDFDQPQAVAAALCGLWTAVADQPDTVRRDLIIQQQVSIRSEGVAFSDPAYQDDEYSIDSNQYSVNGEALQLPQLRSGDQADENLPGFARRLQMLLRGVRRTFGRGAWRVEWADDGEVCWLLQVNPLPDPPVRPEEFVPLALGEIRPLPTLFPLIEQTTGDLYHHLFGRLDKHLPAIRPPLLKMEGDQLLFNQSLLLDTMRHWGLATQPVDALLGSGARRSFGPQRGRLLRRVPLLLRLGLRQLWTAAQAESQTAYWLRQVNAAEGDETATSPGSVQAVIQAQANLWVAAITAQLRMLGPIGPDNPRLAQAQAIWQEALAQAQAIEAS
jgi:rifampicin phosphotransferase